jgi:hypothetical protein
VKVSVLPVLLAPQPSAPLAPLGFHA